MSEIKTNAGFDSDLHPPADIPASLAEKLIVYVVMAIIIVADQITKGLVESRVPLNHFWAPFPEQAELLRITHVSNTGAAFGIFPSGSPVFMVVAIVVAIVILIYNQKLPAHHEWYRLAFGLQLGGALGNLIDRFRIGHVTDFIDVGPVPVFNIADASIVVGTILLGFLILIDERADRSGKQSDEVPEDQVDKPMPESNEERSMLWNE